DKEDENIMKSDTDMGMNDDTDDDMDDNMVYDENSIDEYLIDKKWDNKYQHILTLIEFIHK
ncbi:25666_t:CDS:1, partial [Racocetra persica]